MPRRWLEEKLVEALTSASSDYAQGMKTFEQYSEPLDRLENSLVGVLARTEDQGAQQAPLNAFNPGKAGPVPWLRRGRRSCGLGRMA